MEENNYIKIYTDGATVGWNGKLGTVKEVGLGVYIPHLKKGYTKKTDGISNNEAEFKALIAGMKIAIMHKFKNVIFYLDSKIVVNRANGYKPKKKKYQNKRMDNFQNEVLNLVKEFDNIKFIHIPREMNAKADELSKKSL